MKKFKPMLAPNDKVNLDKIKYPILASYKLDGIRCLFIKGEMLSRSLKPIQNKQLREKMKPLADYSREHDCILDGEIYNPSIPFQAITSCVMTQDHNDKKAIKTWEEICVENSFEITREEAIKDLKFYLFDVVVNDDFNEKFKDRIFEIEESLDEFKHLIKCVEQWSMHSKNDVEDLFENALGNGYEGLILKDLSGKYKCGRGTIKEGLIYKVKPFVTFDAEILGVVQATEVDPNAEKKINELGRSVTSKKKGDRILIDKASAFEVEYEGKRLKITLAMTDEEKEAVWAKRSTHIGKIIEYKGMLVGSKDVPRHPVMIRFREDKE